MKHEEARIETDKDKAMEDARIKVAADATLRAAHATLRGADACAGCEDAECCPTK